MKSGEKQILPLKKRKAILYTSSNGKPHFDLYWSSRFKLDLLSLLSCVMFIFSTPFTMFSTEAAAILFTVFHVNPRFSFTWRQMIQLNIRFFKYCCVSLLRHFVILKFIVMLVIVESIYIANGTLILNKSVGMGNNRFEALKRLQNFKSLIHYDFRPISIRNKFCNAVDLYNYLYTFFPDAHSFINKNMTNTQTVEP